VRVLDAIEFLLRPRCPFRPYVSPFFSPMPNVQSIQFGEEVQFELSVNCLGESRLGKCSFLSRIDWDGGQQQGIPGNGLEYSRTTLGDVEELLRMNVLHPAGIVMCCRGWEGIFKSLESGLIFTKSSEKLCGAKSQKGLRSCD
jgi:hypothetical protein